MSSLGANDELAWHSVYQIANARRLEWPFPHLVVENFLHPEVFSTVKRIFASRELQVRDPDMGYGRNFRTLINLADQFKAGELTDPDSLQLLNALTFGPLVQILVQRLKSAIESRHGSAKLDCTYGLELMRDLSGYALSPHVDGSQKVLTELIYVECEQVDVELGTSLYVMSKPERAPKEFDTSTALGRNLFSKVRTVPFVPALFFAPTSNSYHGVEPVEGGASRSLIQFNVNRADA